MRTGHVLIDLSAREVLNLYVERRVREEIAGAAVLGRMFGTLAEVLAEAVKLLFFKGNPEGFLEEGAVTYEIKKVRWEDIQHGN